MTFRHYFAVALLGLPTLAFAHPGHGLQPGIVAGFMHPLSGVDHLMAMLAIGLWASQLGGRLRWVVPLSFVCLMLSGAVLGISGLQFGPVEQGIAASVCVLGVLLAGAVRLPAMLCVLLAGAFALFHGYAHGAEAPASGVAMFMTGFAFSTGLLHLVGMLIASRMQRMQRPQAIRWAGAAMALSGLALFAI